MASPTPAKIEAAVRDLEERTLAELPGDLTRLVYLSSTRDYNTGEYQHAGLADRYGAETAQCALARCHQSAFEDLVQLRLADLVLQLATYIESTGAERDKVLATWRDLEAYRVLIPVSCDRLSAEFFVSNIKLALEVLRSGPAPSQAR